MDSMRRLIDSVDESKQENNQIPMPNDYYGWYKYQDPFADTYIYISKWLKAFDQLKRKNQNINIDALKRNFEKFKEMLFVSRHSKRYKININMLEKINSLINDIDKDIKSYEEFKVNWPVYHRRIVSYLENIQDLIEAANEDKDVKRSLGYFNEQSYIKPYNYITNWIVRLYEIDKPNVNDLKKDLNTMVDFLYEIPSYKKFASPTIIRAKIKKSKKTTEHVSYQKLQKFFNDEHDSFTKIYFFSNSINAEISDYQREIGDIRIKENYWSEHRAKIIDHLKEIQKEINQLHKNGSLLNKMLRYLDFVPNPKNPLMKS